MPNIIEIEQHTQKLQQQNVEFRRKLDQEAAEVDRSVSVMKGKIKMLDGRVTDLETHYSSELDKSKKENKDVSEKLLDTTTQRDQLLTEKDGLLEEVAALRSRMEELRQSKDREIRGLTDELNRANRKTEALEWEKQELIQNYETESGNNKERLRSVSLRLDEKTESLRQTDEENARLRDELMTQTQAAQDRMVQEIRKIQAESELERERRERKASQEREAFEAQIQDLRLQVSSAREEAETFRVKCSQMTAEITDLKMDLGQEKAKGARLSETVDDLEEKLSNNNSQFLTLDSELKSRVNEYESLLRRYKPHETKGRIEELADSLPEVHF